MIRNYWKKMLSLVIALSLSLGFMIQMPLYTTAAETEEPLLSIAFLSDLHNQQSLITGNVDTVRLRGVVENTLKAIKEEENIDMMVLCGDYTSDASNVPQENWERIRELINDAALNAFPDDATEKPILWVNGNHDYEISRSYNAGDFYTYPMKDSVGVLSEEDCFYEMTYDNQHELLAAYHYNLYGFDFLCLNTGNFIYSNPNGSGSYTGYNYSLESVQWVEDKLEEICKDDPNKTVFFVAHIPFDDSNSINKGKGQDETKEATKLLKKTLAKYPNLIHFYGHDHGKDSAYIRTDTAQRVTQYNTNAEKISVAQVSPMWKIAANGSGYTIKNELTQEYLGYADDNLMLFAGNEQICGLTQKSGNTWNITVDSTERPNLYFSTSSKTFSANLAVCDLELYKKVSAENGTVHFEPAEEISADESYIIVKIDDNTPYLLTNEDNGSTGTSLRMIPATGAVSGTGIDYQESEEGMEPSFITTFVGSMRYYSSSIDGGSSINNSKIVQALMVYVYKDRVELHMKNYGEYDYYDQNYPGTSILISKELKPFITYRDVLGNRVQTKELEELVYEFDRISLTGYSSESIRTFIAKLTEAKQFLEIELDADDQEAVNQMVLELKAVKEGLQSVPEVVEPQEPGTPEKPTEPTTPTEPTAPTEKKLKKPVIKSKKTKNNKVKITWKKQANATGYLVQYKKNGGKYKTLKNVKKNKTISVTSKKLKKGTYRFRMRAYNAAGKSAWSKVVKVKIK